MAERRKTSRDHQIVVAIDGPAAAGKSSTAQWVAKRLGFKPRRLRARSTGP